MLKVFGSSRIGLKTTQGARLRRRTTVAATEGVRRVRVARRSRIALEDLGPGRGSGDAFRGFAARSRTRSGGGDTVVDAGARAGSAVAGLSIRKPEWRPARSRAWTAICSPRAARACVSKPRRSPRLPRRGRRTSRPIPARTRGANVRGALLGAALATAAHAAYALADAAIRTARTPLSLCSRAPPARSPRSSLSARIHSRPRSRPIPWRRSCAAPICWTATGSSAAGRVPRRRVRARGGLLGHHRARARARREGGAARAQKEDWCCSPSARAAAALRADAARALAAAAAVAALALARASPLCARARRSASASACTRGSAARSRGTTRTYLDAVRKRRERRRAASYAASRAEEGGVPRRARRGGAGQRSPKSALRRTLCGAP